MRNAKYLCLLAIVFVCAAAHADEGMWTYDNFPTARVQAHYGWAPDAAWLKHAQLASIRLAQGCSASLVSADGLVMTNHHCVRQCLAGLSDSQHDLETIGFLAVRSEDEQKCPDLEGDQLVDISDVTAAVDAATVGKSGKEFHEAERAIKSQLERSCSSSADVRCDVVTLYQGGVYNLYKYRRYQDLRVVFAPEHGIAFFGGDPDNFTFPRYDLDVSFVRIYDHGKPLKATEYLKFAHQGVREGDLAFTSGNPGNTSREDTLAQLQFQRDVMHPFLLEFYSELRGLLNEFATKGSEEARISAATRFGIENSLKAFKGRQLSLVQGSILADKVRAEADLRQRVSKDSELAASTSDAWDAIAAAEQHKRDIYVRYSLLEGFPRALKLVGRVRALERYAVESAKPDGERLEEYGNSNLPALRAQITTPEPVHAKLEQTLIAWWLTKVREYLGTEDPDVRRLLGKRSPEEIAAEIVGNTELGDPTLRTQLFEGGPAAISAYHDPAIEFARTLDRMSRVVRVDIEDNVRAVETRNAGLIAKARFKLDGKNTYPDATFTLRISYGAVQGYVENGHRVAPTTSVGGAYGHATGREPFALPATWVAAEKTIDTNLNLNFASTNDIIGGNSGSPVIGRNGDAIGLIFDGNIQSLGGDFGYDAAVNRAVAVDVTGILGALKSVYHAERLVKELSH